MMSQKKSLMRAFLGASWGGFLGGLQYFCKMIDPSVKIITNGKCPAGLPLTSV